MGGADLAEQVASAISGGNLTWARGSIDRVVALGVVGLRMRSLAPGYRRRVPPKMLVQLVTMTYRLKLAGDAKQYADGECAVRNLAGALNRRWNWRNSPGGLRQMSRTVLRYWLCDNCLECTGRGYELVPGTPALSARTCPECGGSGKAPRPWDVAGLRGAVLRAREGEHHDALYAELQGVEHEVSEVLRRLLSG